jgi:hypothetical protein
MKNYQENIVPAVNQNAENVFLYENPNSKIKVLFVGNSITRHAPKPDIGWYNDCGMAASSLENDYVHLIVKKIKEKYDENLSFAIAQVSAFERDFATMEPSELYQSAKDFNADIVITFFGANVSHEYDKTANPVKTFASTYANMCDYLSNGRAKVYHGMGFYIRDRLDEEKSSVAKERGEVFMDISDIRARDDSHGLFNHPGDLGMAMIADRFFSYVEKGVLEILKK